MNPTSQPTLLSAKSTARASLFRLAAVLAVCLAVLTQSASATTYNVFGGTKSTWPSTWQTLPGLVSSAVNSGLSGSLSRLDFVGDATYPTAAYASDANYVYFRVRINSADPGYPNELWTHTIMLLIDNNNDGVPESAFSWDTKGGGTDHQLELNIPDPASPNTTSSRWNTVNMIDRDGNSGSKTQPDFNTISGHTDDGYVRLVSQQDGPSGASTTTFVEFAVKWAYLTGTYSSASISPLTPGQTWRVQFGSINDGTDHVNINADVAGSATLTTTLGTAGAWSDPINPTATYTWTGGAGGGDLNWNTAANWDAGAVPVNGCDIIFPAVGPTLVNPANNMTGLTLHSVTITGSGYTISGNSVSISAGFTNSSGALSAFNCPLTLTAAQTFQLTGNTTFAGTIANNYALTVYSATDKTSEFQEVISGTGGITKIGGGVLKISGKVNTYTGKTLVTGGTLFIDRESSLGGNPGSFTADQLKLDGGTLQVNNNANIGQNNVNSGVTLGTGGGTFITDPLVEFDVRKAITGAGALTKTGVGTMKLSAANTYDGKTIINEGILSINAETRLGNNPAIFTADSLTINGGTLNASGDVTIDDSNRGITLGASGGTVSVDDGFTLTVAKAVTGSGSLTKTVGGTLKLSVANTYAGRTIVSAGILSIDGEDRLGSNPGSATANQLELASGTTLNAFGSFTIDDSNRGITLSSGTVTVSVDTGVTLQVANVIAGSGGALTKTGTGVLTLSGINTYSGATTVSAGKLIGVTGASCANSALTVGATTATNSVSVTAINGYWTCASLAYSAAGKLHFNFGSIVPSTSVAPLQVNGNMDFTATPGVIIEALSIPSGAGDYPLITWTGTKSGTAPTTATVPSRVVHP